MLEEAEFNLLKIRIYVLSANHLVTVVFLSQNTQAGFNNSTSQPQHKMKSGLCRQQIQNDIKNKFWQKITGISNQTSMLDVDVMPVLISSGLCLTYSSSARTYQRSGNIIKLHMLSEKCNVCAPLKLLHEALSTTVAKKN